MSTFVSNAPVPPTDGSSINSNTNGQLQTVIGEQLIAGTYANVGDGGSGVWTDILSLTSPAARKANQTMTVEGWASFSSAQAGGGGTVAVRVYNVTDSTAVATSTGQLFSASQGGRIMGVTGTFAIAAVGATKALKLQFQRTGGSAVAADSYSRIAAWS